MRLGIVAAMRKQCFRCRVTKEATSFYVTAQHLDGLSSNCKECCCALGKIHRKQCPDVYARASKKWRQKNLERDRARCRNTAQQWRKKHPDDGRLYIEKWRLDNPDGHAVRMKKQAQSRKERRIADAAYRDRVRDLKTASKYNMTLDVFREYRDRLFVEQKGVCAACKQKPNYRTERTRKLFMDHDHSTGHPRGLLCAGCNAALGQVRESPDTLRGLAKYIENHRACAEAREEKLISFAGRVAEG